MWTHIELTEKQFLQLVTKLPDVAGGLVLYGGIDTREREMIMDELAYKLTKQSWPLNATSERKTKSFMKQFYTEAKKKRYKIERGFTFAGLS